jgi:hypothetical protein
VKGVKFGEIRCFSGHDIALSGVRALQLRAKAAAKSPGNKRGKSSSTCGAQGGKSGPHSGYWRLLVRCHMRASFEAFAPAVGGKPRRSGAGPEGGVRQHRNGESRCMHVPRSDIDLMPEGGKATPGELVLLPPDAKVRFPRNGQPRKGSYLLCSAAAVSMFSSTDGSVRWHRKRGSSGLDVPWRGQFDAASLFFCLQAKRCVPLSWGEQTYQICAHTPQTLVMCIEYFERGARCTFRWEPMVGRDGTERERAPAWMCRGVTSI